ncbi:MAG: hypothetical protein ABI867_07610 [Kofleriaceae bacterium]
MGSRARPARRDQARQAAHRAARERILLEGQALAKVSHPNVVPVYDVGLYEDQIYLVMVWVRGDTADPVTRHAGSSRAARIIR